MKADVIEEPSLEELDPHDKVARLQLRGYFLGRFLWAEDHEELRKWGMQIKNTFSEYMTMYDIAFLRDWYESVDATMRMETAMGVKFSDKAKAKDSIWLNADDIPDGKEVKVTIATIEFSSHFRDDEEEWAITFEGKDKGMTLNVGNRKKLEAAFGDDSDACVGKEIFIYKEPTEFNNKPTMGLRIRIEGEVEDTPF